MSWKESKVRIFPPQVLNAQDRKPDIQDLFLLASQATALRNTTLSVSEDVTPSTSSTPNVSLPLHPVKVEPGPHVINLPPPVPLPVPQVHGPKPSSSNSQLISSSYNDCAIMPPPPPPPPRPSNSPGVTSTSEETEIQSHVTHSGPALGKTLNFASQYKSLLNRIDQ